MRFEILNVYEKKFNVIEIWLRLENVVVQRIHTNTNTIHTNTNTIHTNTNTIHTNTNTIHTNTKTI